MKWKYQLVLQFPFSGLADYDAMTVLEDALVAELGNKAFGGTIGVKAKLYTLQVKLVDSDLIIEFQIKKDTAYPKYSSACLPSGRDGLQASLT
jgi:hypothetical protein